VPAHGPALLERPKLCEGAACKIEIEGMPAPSGRAVVAILWGMSTRRRPPPVLQRRALAAAFCFLPAWVFAQAVPAGDWRSAPASARIGYETLTLPGDERMGLVGMSYLVQVRPGLCLGPAVYGAASGQRGGFFTIGADAALCTQLAGPLGLQAGLYVGGGGGAAAPVGGGLMLRPYANLLWDFGPLRAGV